MSAELVPSLTLKKADGSDGSGGVAGAAEKGIWYAHHTADHIEKTLQEDGDKERAMKKLQDRLEHLKSQVGLLKEPSQGADVPAVGGKAVIDAAPLPDIEDDDDDLPVEAEVGGGGDDSDVVVQQVEAAKRMFSESQKQPKTWQLADSISTPGLVTAQKTPGDGGAAGEPAAISAPVSTAPTDLRDETSAQSARPLPPVAVVKPALAMMRRSAAPASVTRASTDDVPHNVPSNPPTAVVPAPAEPAVGTNSEMSNTEVLAALDELHHAEWHVSASHDFDGGLGDGEDTGVSMPDSGAPEVDTTIVADPLNSSDVYMPPATAASRHLDEVPPSVAAVEASRHIHHPVDIANDLAPADREEDDDAINAPLSMPDVAVRSERDVAADAAERQAAAEAIALEASLLRKAEEDIVRREQQRQAAEAEGQRELERLAYADDLAKKRADEDRRKAEAAAAEQARSESQREAAASKLAKARSEEEAKQRAKDLAARRKEEDIAAQQAAKEEKLRLRSQAQEEKERKKREEAEARRAKEEAKRVEAAKKAEAKRAAQEHAKTSATVSEKDKARFAQLEAAKQQNQESQDTAKKQRASDAASRRVQLEELGRQQKLAEEQSKQEDREARVKSDNTMVTAHATIALKAAEDRRLKALQMAEANREKARQKSQAMKEEAARIQGDGQGGGPLPVERRPTKVGGDSIPVVVVKAFQHDDDRMMNVAAGDRVLVNGFKGKYLKVSLPDGSRKGFLPPKIVQDGKAMYDTLLAEELRATGETQ